VEVTGDKNVLMLIYKHLYFRNFPGCDTRTPAKGEGGSIITFGVLEGPQNVYRCQGKFASGLYHATLHNFTSFNSAFSAMQAVNLSREKPLNRKLVGVI